MGSAGHPGELTLQGPVSVSVPMPLQEPRLPGVVGDGLELQAALCWSTCLPGRACSRDLTACQCRRDRGCDAQHCLGADRLTDDQSR